ncbi:MAG: hypothetical protein JWQ90_711 [Hydrocarboniphaga sp.]|uniref:reprolysin-like metallopeptidase n=1 Tax=Hydrocarboniphaga sp. TaxID=2033016 RepID=UPI0026202D2E|nr:zinc-dependent metalloprotease family protein [Hydrocarboniphaga sp.]MDB5968261.1 hypothetical protein [Hydrocarboniphaga sp.]
MRSLTPVLTACCMAAFFCGPAAAASSSLWADAPASASKLTTPRLIEPSKARIFDLDSPALRAQLAALPDESTPLSSRPAIKLPMPDGSSISFRIAATAVMAPALAARYPQILTFAGVSESDPDISGRFDIGPRGFHGQIFTSKGTVFIDPLRRGETRIHQVYYTRDMPARRRAPDVIDSALSGIVQRTAASAVGTDGVSIATDLRTYRLALATTGEYAEYQDPDNATPDKSIVLAELVNVVNRVTGVYEREVGVRMQLIANEDAIIYTDPTTDPYANSSGSLMVNTNTRILNTAIGSGAYDIGHVVSTGGGGIAGLGVVCGGSKGAGVTGLPDPIGDAFYIDYVAHEMGHQYGANHTFNSQTGSCGGGNRNASTAYEPGSGTTIMAYAGICGADDIQPHSDDYFQSVSFDEIVDYTRNGTGNSCAAVTASGNQAPSADAGAGGFTIPMQTPFELTAVKSTDPDGNKLSYQWEEMDLGAAGAPDSPDASAPLFRSFLPTKNKTRVFPQLSDLLNNTHTIGEILPAVSRTLNFRLNVRDNQVAPSSGGVASSLMSFSVTGSAGPFKLLTPNTAATYAAGSKLKVTWDVAGTNLAPVSCSTIDVYLSTDGGQSFTTKLRKVSNTGKTNVTLPILDTSTARLKLKCNGNVFFDVSDASFAITTAP